MNNFGDFNISRNAFRQDPIEYWRLISLFGCYLSHAKMQCNCIVRECLRREMDFESRLEIVDAQGTITIHV